VHVQRLKIDPLAKRFRKISESQMGGYSSGRYRTRNRGAVEQAQTFNTRTLRRLGFLKAGGVTSGPLRWSRQGEVFASIAIAVDLTQSEHGTARLSYSVNAEPRSQTIRLEATPCRFGGCRYYFICPLSGRRCETLCFARGMFASRQEQRLTYASQSEDRLSRLHRKRDKLRDRLDGTSGRPKPRGKNRERLVSRWLDLEEQSDELFAQEALRRFGALL
jgi:hypothetical protein